MSITMLSCVSTGEQQAREPEGTIIKSPADKREYRSITLDNGLRVMLVHDDKADHSAAALDVNVGSGHDPKDRQGMAHYLEHMLFLGTEKYPEAGEYQQYISAHGGSNNAYTILDHTNYFFNITPDYLEGALDRFSQFFIAPLFNEAYVTRERSVVHSEYKARKNDESRRLWTARRVIYNQDHPSTQFSVGSLETLADRDADPVREDLVAFYKQYYRAPNMALSVISHHSLDQLQEWVEAKFGPIVGSGHAVSSFDMPLISQTDLPVKLTLKPIKETRQVSFSFPIESVEPYADSKPSVYLSNLLGHEGEGSLLAALKSRSWANSLSAGLGFADSVQATFDIKIDLSAKGFENIDEIGELLFSTIELIREQGVKQIYFDELKQLAELDFRFQEKSEEGALVQRLASQLHRYTPDEILSVPYRYTNFDPVAIRNILERLRPDNVQLIVTDPELESTQTTDWYDVAYSINDINADWLQRWQQASLNDEIKLPSPNPFIPQNVALIEPDDAQAEVPQLIRESNNIQLWHQTQLDFEQPKAELYFSLRSNASNNSAREAVLTELYAYAVKEALSAFYYPAYLAGLEYRIYRHSRGLSVRISGYSDRQALLLDKVISTMVSIDIDAQQFELYTENIKRSLENSLKGRPSEIVINGVYDVLLTSSWSSEEKLDALASIDFAMFSAHKKALLAGPEIVVLSVGNIEERDSLRAGDALTKLVMGSAQQHVPRARVRKLERGKWTLREARALHDDAAIALVFQGQSKDIKELAATQLLGSLIRTPYYQTLRTEAEIGYIVSAFAFNVLDAPALGFSVQSNSHAVQDIVAQTALFLEAYEQVLIDLPDETFDSTKAGLIARLVQEDKQLGDVAARYWSELDREAYEFDTRQQMVAAVENIEKQALAEYFHRLVRSEDAVALLSYSFGDKSTKLSLPGQSSAIEYQSLANIRQAVKHYF